MLVSFLIAAGAGVGIGCFFRASALIVASIALLIYAAVMRDGSDVISSVAITLGLLTTLQAGYIFGLALSSFRKKTAHFPKLQRNKLTPDDACLKNGSRQSGLHPADLK